MKKCVSQVHEGMIVRSLNKKFSGWMMMVENHHKNRYAQLMVDATECVFFR